MFPTFVTSPDLIIAIAGFLLAAGFYYIPGLNAKFAALGKEVKQLIMLGLITVAALAVFGLTCAGVTSTGLICSGKGLWSLAWYWILALMTNVGGAQGLPQPPAVKTAKQAAAQLQAISDANAAQAQPK
jgi:hypothetical protein